MTNLTKNSLIENINLIKKKEIKSEELTSAYVQNIKKGKKLNSFITECCESAITNAKNFIKNQILMVYYPVYRSRLKIYFAQVVLRLPLQAKC